MASPEVNSSFATQMRNPRGPADKLVGWRTMRGWYFMTIGSSLFIGMALGLWLVQGSLLAQSSETVPIPPLYYTLQPFGLLSLGLGIILQLLSFRINPFRQT